MCLSEISAQGENSKMCREVHLEERPNRSLLLIDYYGEYYELLSKSIDICKSLISD